MSSANAHDDDTLPSGLRDTARKQRLHALTAAPWRCCAHCAVPQAAGHLQERLVELDVSGCKVVGLANLTGLAALRVLRAVNCESIKDAQLQPAFSSCP